MSLTKQRQSVENANDEEEEESLVNNTHTSSARKPNHHLLNQTKKQIQIDEFQAELNHNLIKFRNENLFTDIYIYVEGVEFPCHKVILCASSSYFKAMFSCDLKESRLGKVFIENISSWTMKRLLDFIYTGKIEINYDNVIDIFNAAAMFQLYKLADKCTDYIEEHIDLTNCIDIHVFASLHQLQKLEKDTFQFILDNFMQLINALPSVPVTLKSNQATASLLDELNLTNQLINCVNSVNTTTSDTVYFSDFVLLSESSFQSLIKSDLLNVSREIYVYYAVKKWIEYQTLAAGSSSKTKLNKMYENLFKHIRLNALSKDELEFMLKNDKLVNSNPMLLGHLKSFLNDHYHQDAALLSKLDSKLETLTQLESNNIRPSTMPREYLCLLESNQFQFYDLYKSKWDCLNSWPPSSSHSRSTLMPFHSAHVNSNPTSLNGYSTCIVNNLLYIIGGYADQIDNLVDCVWRFDPIKNEWSSCRGMLRKRAFHLSICLNGTSSASSNQSSKENNFIFLFYGICYLNSNDHNESAPQIRAQTSILTQCLSIDYYNIHTDQWCALVSTNSSLLNHHIFQSLNNLNRSISNNSAESDELNLSAINQLIENQLAQSKTIVSLKNLIYILKENCINCYEFNSDVEQLICLPYFRLPANLSTFSLATALPARVTATNCSASSNLFSWHSDNEESLLASPQQQEAMLKTELDFSSILKHQDDLVEANSAHFVTTTTTKQQQQHKKEALIYLINPQKRALYEFYPARNKLKKLPNLTLKHLPNETFVLNIKSKLYVTGGLVESVAGAANEMEQGNEIEVLDEDRTSWSLFKQNFTTNSSLATTNTTLKLTKHFFKLKMSLV